MKTEHKMKNSNYLLPLTMAISIALFTAGCGPSKEEERKELIQKDKEEEKRVIDQLANKYKAIFFSPRGLGTTTFTYEIQEVITTHSQKPLIFKGYLEDIQRTKDGIIIEFVYPLRDGENYFFDSKSLRYRLIISEDSVKQFIKGGRKDPMSHLFRYLSGPDYYVVAKIDSIDSSRMYSFNAHDDYEYVEIESEVTKSFIATGQFLDAVYISIE